LGCFGNIITTGGLFMKKIAIGTLLFLLASLCFARGIRDGYDFGIGFHNISENRTVDDIDFKTTVPSLAIGFAGISYFTEKFGWAGYGNFLLPLQVKIETSDESMLTKRSDSDLMFSMSLLTGPVFVLHKTETFLLSLCPGVHLYILLADMDRGHIDTLQIGLGTVATGEYHVGKNFYLYGRFQLTCDFILLSYPADNFFSWGIAPSIGIGLKW
jgi:hypothetical protein